jgi:hypothetical protein
MDLAKLFREITSILFETTCKKDRVQLIEKNIFIIYLSINRALSIIHYENIFKIFSYFLRYLSQVFPKIYKA